MFTMTDWTAETFETGYGYINFHVEGFWSTDTVHVSVRREENYLPTFDTGPAQLTITKWEVSVGWSSGGMSKNFDNLTAARNHAAAIAKAVEVAEYIKANTEPFEVAYRAYRDELAEQTRVAAEEKQKREEADQAVSDARAKLIMTYLKEVGGVFKMVPRGVSDEEYTSKRYRGVHCMGYDKRVFYFGDSRTNKNEILLLIKQSSNRGKLCGANGEIIAI
jgi:hypothetical protein